MDQRWLRRHRFDDVRYYAKLSYQRGSLSAFQKPVRYVRPGGNVGEWHDSRMGISAGTHGGSWALNSASLTRAPREDRTEARSASATGFRVAAIPEPSHGPINIAIDFDSTVDVSDVIYRGIPQTKPGFLSWNATWAFHKDFSGMSRFLTDGVEFQLQARTRTWAACNVFILVLLSPQLLPWATRRSAAGLRLCRGAGRGISLLNGCRPPGGILSNDNLVCANDARCYTRLKR